MAKHHRSRQLVDRIQPGAGKFPTRVQVVRLALCFGALGNKQPATSRSLGRYRQSFGNTYRSELLPHPGLVPFYAVLSVGQLVFIV